MSKVIGCAIAVHRALGPGYLESIYRRAMWIELQAQGIPYEAERSVRVVYRGIEIPGQRVDLIVDESIVVELKTVARFDPVHVAQVVVPQDHRPAGRTADQFPGASAADGPQESGALNEDGWPSCRPS